MLWESSLPPEGEVPVFDSPVVGGGGLYIYSEGTLFALSTRSGKALFSPLTGLTAPPLLREGSLHFGTEDGRLVTVDGLSGRTLRTIRIPDRVSAGPAFVDGRFYAGTEGGRLIVINPEGVAEAR